MPAWKRFGLLAVVLGSVLGSEARAGSLSSRSAWYWWVYNHDLGYSERRVARGGSPHIMNPWSAAWPAASSPATYTATATHTTTPLPSNPAVFSTSSAPVSAPLEVAAPSTPAPAPAPVIAPAHVSNATPAPAAPDAFLNFGDGAYAESGALTTGTIQPWYNSPAVTHVFGGTPTARQQADFTSTVLKDVQQTYQLSGIPLNLTLDPNAHAAHTLSVVSGASFAPNPSAIGITDIGNSGFGFIDNLKYAQSTDQLAWAVAHNISHELMHAFGVAVHHDQTGTYLDSATATWSLLTDPNTTFSPAAVQDILSNLAQAHSNASLQTGAELLGLPPLPHKPGCQCPLCRRGYQLLGVPSPSPVPEPATLALWGLGSAVALIHMNRKGRSKRSCSYAATRGWSR
jgi:hypothetical protein